VVNTDWGLDTAEELKSRFGTPYVCSEYGYPVGYKAMEKMLISICGILDGADPEPALESLRKARAQGYIQIARMNSLTGLPKGVPFAVYAQPAMKNGYSAFLSEYLGMKDVNGTKESMKGGSAGEPDIVLGDGNTIARMKAEGKRFTGIEISLPTVGYIDVIEKTHLGAGGTLFLIEQILNSMIY
jgi:nitrogenase molybdenum-iron protein alpha/beta subunit